MIFKIYNSDFGFKLNGVGYDFTHVDSFTIEDPESTRLTRGANAKNKVGLAYKEGVKDPKRWTVTIMDMSIDIKALLDGIHKDQSRVDVYCIDRSNGSMKIAKNAVLCQQPQQLTVDESPESMAVALIFETFDSIETFKEVS